jgi:ATP-dependent Lhr-like helicase
MAEKFEKQKNQKEILEFVHRYLYCDANAAKAICHYFWEQHRYAKIPHKKRLFIEKIPGKGKEQYVVFHALYGRRVNDALSRALGWVVSKLIHKDVGISVNDNGFLITANQKIPLEHALNVLKKENLRKIAEKSIEQSEVLKRRFRHCATRALMILRKYKGREKSVSRQQMSSHLLINAVKYVNENFCILREAKREVLEDLMDIQGAEEVIEKLKKEEVKTEIVQHTLPSPFAFNIFAMGRSDTVRIESRLAFIQRLHKEIMEKIQHDTTVAIERH